MLQNSWQNRSYTKLLKVSAYKNQTPAYKNRHFLDVKTKFTFPWRKGVSVSQQVWDTWMDVDRDHDNWTSRIYHRWSYGGRYRQVGRWCVWRSIVELPIMKCGTHWLPQIGVFASTVSVTHYFAKNEKYNFEINNCLRNYIFAIVVRGHFPLEVSNTKPMLTMSMAPWDDQSYGSIMKWCSVRITAVVNIATHAPPRCMIPQHACKYNRNFESLLPRASGTEA